MFMSTARLTQAPLSIEGHYEKVTRRWEADQGAGWGS